MKLRASFAAAGAAVALCATGAFVLPAMASEHSITHTLKFVSVPNRFKVHFTKATKGEQETDFNRAGTPIGFDMLYLADTSAGRAAAHLTVDTPGGFLYGTFTLNLKTGAVTNGTVTGGTGGFAGATGTIKAEPVNRAPTKHVVTITYSS